MYGDIKSQLKKLRSASVNPRANWAARNRTQLLSQIKNTVSLGERTHISDRTWNALSLFIPRRMVFSVVRPVALVLIIAVTLTTAYSGTVKASYDALPGDTLYPAKRLVENIPVTVASLVGDNSTETKLRSENAKRRAVEVTMLLRTDDPAKLSKAVQTVSDLKDEIASIDAKLNATKDSQAPIAAEAVKDVKQNTDEIKVVLQDVKTDLLVSATSTVVPLAQEVADAKNLVKDVSVKAVEVIVTKHLEGDTSVSKDDVTKMINNTLTDVVNEAAQSKQTVDATKSMVDAVKLEVKDLSVDVGKQNDPALTSSTKKFSDQLNSVASLTQAAAVQTNAVSQVVDQKASQVQTLVNAGNFAQALDTMKQVSQATKEVEKISDATMQSTQNVLPGVQVIVDAVTQPASPSSSLITATPIVSTTSLNALKNVIGSTTIMTPTSVTAAVLTSTTNTVNAAKPGATTTDTKK